MEPTDSFAPTFAAIASHFTEAELAAFAHVLEPRKLGAGEVLFRDGEPSADLYLVKSGTLAIRVTIDGRGYDLGTLGPGAVVGEIALMDPGVAVGTVTAEGEATVLVMTERGLDEVARAEPRVATALLRTLSATISARLRSLEERTDEILASIDPQLSLVQAPAETGLLYYFRTLFGGRRD